MMAPSPSRPLQKKCTDSRRAVKDLALTFYAGVEEEVPQVSKKIIMKNDTSDVQRWENIGREVQGNRDQEVKNRKSLERIFLKGLEKGVASLHRKNLNVRPRGLEREENPIRGREEVTFGIKTGKTRT